MYLIKENNIQFQNLAGSLDDLKDFRQICVSITLINQL